MENENMTREEAVAISKKANNFIKKYGYVYDNNNNRRRKNVKVMVMSSHNDKYWTPVLILTAGYYNGFCLNSVFIENGVPHVSQWSCGPIVYKKGGIERFNKEYSPEKQEGHPYWMYHLYEA